MAGLSDSAWEALAAEIDGPAVAEPSPAEPASPEALVQTDASATAPEESGVATEPVAEAPATQTETPDPRLADLEAREAALAERERAEAQRQREIAAKWQAFQEQEANKQAAAYYQELVDEAGQETADKFKEFRQGIVTQRRQAEARAEGAERGLVAAMIALENEVDPATFQRILDVTGELVNYADAEQMQSAIQQRKQQQAAQSAELTAAMETIKELRARLDAQERPANADAVDRGMAGPGSGTKIEDAPDFDTFFGQLTSTLPASWQ